MSSKLKIKFCGFTREEDIGHAIAVGCDFIGINFSKTSPRMVSAAQAAALSRTLAATSQTRRAEGQMAAAVGIFVDPTMEEIAEAVSLVPQIQTIQLHGSETIEQIRAFAKTFSQFRFWKAVGVRDSESLKEAAKFAPLCELVILDSKPKITADGTVQRGGTGEAFDWSLIPPGAISFPFGIAGGITLANLGTAINLHPQLIDISSGAESAIGVKSFEIMRQIAERIHRAGA